MATNIYHVTKFGRINFTRFKLFKGTRQTSDPN